MPLFGKKDSNKKIKKDGKDDRSPSVEDKYILKELLGTYVLYIDTDCVSESNTTDCTRFLYSYLSYCG